MRRTTPRMLVWLVLLWRPSVRTRPRVLFSRRALVCVPLCAMATLATRCSNPPLGPSLTDVTLANVSLQSTAGDASLCCCRAIGTATNRNSIAVDVTVKFSAFNGSDPLPLATVIYFIENLKPQEQHRIEASGFLFSCSRITELKSEVDVKGLQSPPF